MKNNTISVIRMLSMLMIISCHILQGLNNKWAFWFNVGVQIFFFISGFLYGKKELKNIKMFYLERIKKILIPYMVLFIWAFILEVFLLKNNYSLSLIIGSFLGFGGFNGTFPIITHTWFLSYILVCYLILPVLNNIFESKDFKKNIIKLILLLIFIQLLEEFSVIKISACWINNFILGYFYNRCCNNKENKKIYEIGLFLMFILVIPLAIIYQENINITLPVLLNNNSNLIMQYGHVLLGSIIFIFLYKILNQFKIKDNFILKFSDKYSYYIYLVHQIFILYSFSILFLTDNLFINIMLILISSLLFGILLKIISDKFIKNL